MTYLDVSLQIIFLVAMGLPNDRIAQSHDRASETHKDPFGFDFAARCVTEQLREGMAKISTMNVNAKTTQMLEAQPVKQQPQHLELDAGKLFASTCAATGDNFASANARRLADQKFDDMVNGPQEKQKLASVAEPVTASPPWLRDYSPEQPQKKAA